MNLELILEYNLNEAEAKAVKLCILWEQILKKELPNYRKDKPSKGDPRKTLIFKYCYKLLNETKGLIKDSDYKFYIFAQISTLKNYTDGTVHGLIEPSCLAGDKAWLRWKIWKNKFERKAKELENHGKTDQIFKSNPQVVSELKRTRNFLTTNFGETYKETDIKKVIKNKDLLKWVSFSKISPFYLILSPIIKKHFTDLEDSFSVDVEFYKKSINPDVEALFKEMFKCEF